MNRSETTRASSIQVQRQVGTAPAAKEIAAARTAPPSIGGPSAASDPSLLITINELAFQLRVSRRTVWRRVSTGELPVPIAIGRARRWSRAAIAEWVARQVAGPAQGGR